MVITCVQCEVEYRNVRSGVALQTMAGSDPYQIYAADLLECPGCHNRIIRPVPQPMAEHFHPEFAALLLKYRHGDRLFRAWHSMVEKAGTV